MEVQARRAGAWRLMDIASCRDKRVGREHQAARCYMRLEHQATRGYAARCYMRSIRLLDAT
jgi:hypothetical protein